MGWEDVRNWGPLVIMLASLIFSVVQSRGKARKDELEAFRQRGEIADDTLRAAIAGLANSHEKACDNIRAEVKAVFAITDQVDTRLTKVEGEMAHLPEAGSFHRIENTMTRLQGELGVLAERLKPVAAIGERLQDFLIEQATRR